MVQDLHPPRFLNRKLKREERQLREGDLQARQRPTHDTRYKCEKSSRPLTNMSDLTIPGQLVQGHSKTSRLRVRSLRSIVFKLEGWCHAALPLLLVVKRLNTRLRKISSFYQQQHNLRSCLLGSSILFGSSLVIFLAREGSTLRFSALAATSGHPFIPYSVHERKTGEDL